MRRQSQRGAALILLATILVVGVAWFAIGVLGRAAPSSVDRDVRTGPALRTAKAALLGYVAQYAARTDYDVPGRLPCPESLNTIYWTNEGIASSCSNTVTEVGRLPWRTLGMERLVDGYGEPLWYVLSPGFRESPINFGTTGQLTFDGNPNAAVALIIAPGPALNTVNESGTPPTGCTRRNQGARYPAVADTSANQTPLNVLDFLECGNTTGSYVTAGNSTWFNDRAIAITASEWIAAISGPVADRVQRQVAVALRNWDQDEFTATGRSWGVTHGRPYLPFASDWSNPTTNNYCGNQDEYEGLAPIGPTCHNNTWSGGATASGGLSSLGCSNPSGTTYRRCRFERTSPATPLTGRITATASNVARAFRGTIGVADLTITDGGTATISMALPNNTSEGTATIDVSWPLSLAVDTTVEVRIPHLQNAAVLSDSRITWFWNNAWHQYTYYAVAPGATASAIAYALPGWTCGSLFGPACLLTVTGLPASTGNSNDKRLVLVLSGAPLSTQTQPSSNRSNYFESDNRTRDDETFLSATTSTTFNDRIAVCPYKISDAAVLCN